MGRSNPNLPFPAPQGAKGPERGRPCSAEEVERTAPETHSEEVV